MLKAIPRRKVGLGSLLGIPVFLLLALSYFDPLEGAFLFIPPLLLIETGCLIGLRGKRTERPLKRSALLAAVLGTLVSAITVTGLGIYIALMLRAVGYFHANDIGLLLLWIALGTAAGGLLTTASAIPWYMQRNWFRFRLRTILIAMLLFSIPLAWYGVRKQRTRELQRILADLRSHAGAVRVRYDADALRLPWLGRDFPLGVSDVAVVSFGPDSHPDDEALKRISVFKNLRTLDVNRRTQNRITDAGLGQLNELKHVKQLRLPGARITDEGLVHLHNHNRLKALTLRDTLISDKGIEQLEQLVELEMLSVQGTEITDEGAERLRRALPNTLIYYH